MSPSCQPRSRQSPSLLEYAASRQVVLATPTTLIALLRTVAHGWTQEALADQAREIHELGRELHARLGTMGGHLDQVGRSLNAAVGPTTARSARWRAGCWSRRRRFERPRRSPTEPTARRPGWCASRRARDCWPRRPTSAPSCSPPTRSPAVAVRRARGQTLRPLRWPVSAPTLWEEGRSRAVVVALGVLVAAPVVLSTRPGRTSAHVLLRPGLRAPVPGAALAVRPRDFFLVGVLPPLLLLGRRHVVAVRARPGVADPGDGIVQAVVSGLAHRHGGLVIGYLLVLGGAGGCAGAGGHRRAASAAQRHRERRRRSPAPRRTHLGPALGPVDHRGRLGPHSPESTTDVDQWSSSSLISQPSVSGSSSPGSIRVLDSIGSPSSSSSARTTGWSGIRTPTVRFLGCISRFGTSPVAGRMNV